LSGKVLQSHGAPHAAPRFFSHQRGWSLVELTVVLVVGGILAYFAVRAFQQRDAIALQQAERLRNDLRHAQMLALTWNRSLRVSVAGTSYSVSCVTAGASPCNASPVIDPATGRPFQVSLETGLSVAGPGYTLDLDTLGRPRNGAALTGANATYTITGAGTPRTVVVAPVTGFATAQ
jgi:MSHA pilin protein MshC